MSGAPRRIAALLAKDARIHGTEILLTQAGLLGLMAMMRYVAPSDPATLASAVFNLNFIIAGYWSEWLISREKTKGTFAWLRACPVDDRELVAAKFIAVGICCVVLWVFSSALFIGGELVPARLDVWAVLQLALLTFGALAVATRFRFGQKLGQVLPFGIVGILFGLFILSSKAGHTLAVDPERLLGYAAGRGILAAGFVAAYAAIAWTTYRWVRGSDTSALLE